MLRILKQNKAQAIMGEYVLVFFIIIGMVTAMTIYFRRAVQARLRDSKVYMINTIRERTGNQYNGLLWAEYEPYYGNTISNVARSSDMTDQLLGGGTTGIYRQTLNEFTGVDTISVTAPPKDAD